MPQGSQRRTSSTRPSTPSQHLQLLAGSWGFRAHQAGCPMRGALLVPSVVAASAPPSYAAPPSHPTRVSRARREAHTTALSSRSAHTDRRSASRGERSVGRQAASVAAAVATVGVGGRGDLPAHGSPPPLVTGGALGRLTAAMGFDARAQGQAAGSHGRARRSHAPPPPPRSPCRALALCLLRTVAMPTLCTCSGEDNQTARSNQCAAPLTGCGRCILSTPCDVRDARGTASKRRNH